MTKYVIRGKVLDKEFTTYFASSAEDIDEVMYECAYYFSVGSMGCDCNKVVLVGMDDEYSPTNCGDTIKYQELFLLTTEGDEIDLLKEG